MKLGRYAKACAETEKFDRLKGEDITRDQFKARYGENPKQMRESFGNREAEFSPADRQVEVLQGQGAIIAEAARQIGVSRTRSRFFTSEVKIVQFHNVDRWQAWQTVLVQINAENAKTSR